MASEVVSRPLPLRVLALAETETVSGAVKPVLSFYRTCRQCEAGAVELSLAPFERSHAGSASRPNQLSQAAAALGVPVYRLREHFRYDPRTILQLRKLVREINPHIIETHNSKSHFVVQISGLRKKRPWVAFHHGHTRADFRVRLYEGLDRWSLRAPTQVVAVCGAFAQQLVGMGVPREKIVVLHGSVELAPERNFSFEDLQAKKARLGISGTERIVLAIGRLSKEKAYPDLVTAIAELRRLHPALPVRLIILGEGPERPTIEAAIRSAGLERGVSLPGHMRDVSPYYEVADVLAISSLSEGSPNVLLEAMAASVPVVASAVGGIPEIVTDQQQALLVHPRDPRALADALACILTNRCLAQALSRAARSLAATRFSPEQRARTLIELYSNVYQNWQSLYGTHRPSR
jgi:glycosyltransferase involved in cell wall biosynthesis